MNFDRDFVKFCGLLDAIWLLKGPVLAAGAKTLFFSDLEGFPLVEVEAGLRAHRRDPKRGQFLPMPADVIAQINGIVADDGRPGPEEAWALSSKASNESATVVWTEEMSQAYAVCSPLAQAGDEIGARMAFKESYLRLVKDARESRVPVAWTASLGHDPEERDRALLPHVTAGRISPKELSGPRIGLDAMLQLPAPEGSTQTNIEARDKARESLRKLRAEIVGKQPGVSVAELDRQRTDDLKAGARAAVETYTTQKTA